MSQLTTEMRTFLTELSGKSLAKKAVAYALDEASSQNLDIQEP